MGLCSGTGPCQVRSLTIVNILIIKQKLVVRVMHWSMHNSYCNQIMVFAKHYSAEWTLSPDNIEVWVVSGYFLLHILFCYLILLQVPLLKWSSSISPRVTTLLTKPIGQRKIYFWKTRRKTMVSLSNRFLICYKYMTRVVSYFTFILYTGHQVVPLFTTAAGQWSSGARIDSADVLTYDSLGVAKELNGLVSAPLGWHSSEMNDTIKNVVV